MSFIVGLTGGIGSGKTAVSDYLASLGICIVDADVIAHSLTQPGSPLLIELKEAFGDWVLDSQGRYDRAAMRAYIFKHAQELEKLNQIMHPAIKKEISRQLAQSQSAYTVLAVPLLFESHNKPGSPIQLCDHFLVVDVPVDLQRQRASSRDGNNPSQIDAIIAKQISRADRLDLARALGADIIDNTGGTDKLHEQLDKLHLTYLSLAKLSKTPKIQT